MAKLDPARFAERPLNGLRNLSIQLVSYCDNLLQHGRFEIPDDLTEQLGFFQALCEVTGFDSTLPPMTGNAQIDLSALRSHFNDLRIRFTEQAATTGIKDAREKYLLELGQTFRYEFSDGDLSRIQDLLNQLRDRISTSDFFNEKHKERLLKKLEALQAELHKRMSNLDKFYALAGEGAVIMQKYGEAAKPFLDIIKAILRIAWVAQGRAEELPSNAPNILIKTDDQEIV
jgi:hypothetical protein